MPLNFRTIEAFKTLIETGTVSRTAERLFISQPAASKLIASFERAIPFTVFNREGGRLVPTPEARLLYIEIERAFSGMSDIERFAQHVADQTQGHLAVGVLPALSSGVIQKIVAQFLADRPDVHISLQTRTSMQATDLLLSRKIDIAISTNPPDVPGIERIHLLEVPGVCVLPLDHPLAAKDIVRAPDLQGQDFVSLTVLDGSLQRVEASFQREGVTPRIRIETPTSLSACAFAAEGLGISIVDPFAPRTFAGRLHVRRYEPEVLFSFYACLPSDKSYRTLLAQEFLEFFQGNLPTGAIH